ncbi:MAG: hypothetical protein FWG68_12570 [Defluviitaleaceae bacterium]|nr:hypothetical protein [Defluviitaleaceae bacterium]
MKKRRSDRLPPTNEGGVGVGGFTTGDRPASVGATVLGRPFAHLLDGQIPNHSDTN